MVGGSNPSWGNSEVVQWQNGDNVSRDKRKYSDRPEANKAAVVRRRRKVKLMCVEYKGGKCSVCGYNKCIAALEFHHMNPAEKDFSVSKHGACRSWESTKEELDKCILVCANCHREIHDMLRNSPVADW